MFEIANQFAQVNGAVNTVVDEAYGGQGLAGRLTAFALDETVSAGLSIVPVCPYIKKYLEKHAEDHAGHVVVPTPDILQFLSAELAEQRD